MSRISIFLFYCAALAAVNALAGEEIKTTFMMVVAAGTVLFFHWAETRDQK